MNGVAILEQVTPSNIVPQAESDERVVEMWLSQKAPRTRVVYERALHHFLKQSGVGGLHKITASVLIRYAETLEAWVWHRAPATECWQR